MLKLMKHLKKSTALILVAVLLLCGQSFTELLLPSYTSDMVDVGIQQGGIAESIPRIIRQEELDKLLLFVSDADKETVLSVYRLISLDMFDADRLDYELERNPGLKDGPLYEIRQNDKAMLSDAADILAFPMTLMQGMKAEESEDAAGFSAMLSSMGVSSVDAMFETFAKMPEASRLALVDSIRKEFSAMPEAMYAQSSAQYIRGEYEAIGIDVDQEQINYIIIVGLKMLGIALLSMTAAILASLCFARIGAAFSRDMRHEVFKKVLSFSNTEFDKFSTASLITRTTNDVQQVQMFLTMGLRVLCNAPILAIGGIIMVLRTNASMGWIIVLAVAAILCVIGVLYRTTMPRFKVMQKLIDRLNLVMREILGGLSVIRSFSAEKHEEKRFGDANEDLMKTSLFVNRVMSGLMPVLMLIMNVVTVLIMWNGAHGIDTGALQVGDLMAFIQYTMQIISSFLMISMVSIMIPRAGVAAERVEEILSTELSICDPQKPVTVKGKGVVEFKDVSFRYPDASEDVLEHISFTANPGETTAIIGSTGCGKSTLVNLIPRLYDVTEGAVLIDGVDIREMSIHDLREKIGYVPQKGVLFSGTIESNLRLGKSLATDEELRTAAGVAQAHAFIMEKEDAYASEIAQGGTNVSGGQRQRLAIARAIVKKPDIFVFDDSFSALDYKTDVSLRRDLRAHTKDAAVIIVAQRISTILRAEQIIVLDDGKIVGKGTHKELLASCEVYRQIAASQLSKEELDK